MFFLFRHGAIVPDEIVRRGVFLYNRGMTASHFLREPWFRYLERGQQELVRQAYFLFERERTSTQVFDDYSFVVFPMAKAFEGFVKRFLFDLAIIDRTRFLSSHFRIGKSLNPDLPAWYRNEEWVVVKLNDTCGRGVGERLWRAWKEGRNLLFHYFPNASRFVSLDKAGQILEQLAEAMAAALACPAFVRGEKD